MKLCVLLILLCSAAVKANDTDPQYCAYWVKHFEAIAEYEAKRIDVVPRVLEEEGPYAATDLDIEMRERIRAIINKLAN